MENNNQLIRFIRLLRTSLVYILIVSSVFAGISYMVTKTFVTPQYRATTLLIGKSDKSSTVDINTANLQLMMVNTYKGLVQSTVVLEDARESLKKHTGNDFTIDELQGYLNVDGQEDSQIFSVEAMYKEPKLAQKISQEVGDALVDQAEKLLGDGTKLSIISPAQVPTAPISPNIPLNMVFGFLLGMLLCVGVVYFKMLQSSLLEEFDVIDVDLGLRNLGKISDQKRYTEQNTRRKTKRMSINIIQKEDSNEKINSRRSNLYRS